jgi:excinuclease ABC subunit C
VQENLRRQINNITTSSGVYQFFDENDKALYVGKAKNLRNRLRSYLDKKRHNSRIKRMVFLARKIEIITTANEAEALLLECNLIKKLMPRYNILLRDDKSFANILVDITHPFPSISKHRGKKSIKGKYFGPFVNGRAIYETIDVLKKSFLLRSCTDSEFKRRKKPCMEYQIKRCSAPCVGLVDEKIYNDLINEALDFLSGKKAYLQENLAKKMQENSQNLEFEKAQILRDRIKALSAIQAKQNINLKTDENVDFIALWRQGNLACILISFFRKGNNYGFKPYFLNIESDDLKEEIMQSFLDQFYVNQELPDLLVLSCDSNLNENVKTLVPKQGDKFNLLQNYTKIAQEELQKKLATQIKDKEMLIHLKRLFNLPKIPGRIEVYDNSHTSGSFAVGAFVVAGPDGFVKNAYRKFSIKVDDLDKKDDCAFLRQVLQRRFKKSAENIIPDLIIIDGGKGQLNAANEVFKELGVNVSFVAMSKGKNRNAGEEFFHQVAKPSFTMEKHLPLMHYLQRLRDEAHRFAIGFNRSRRAKSVTKSQLDEIKNIGSKRKMLLLNYFGSISAIKQASTEDLMRVKGISKNMAVKILDSF